MDHEHGAHLRFSASRSFELSNPLKRLLDRSPRKFIKLLRVQPDWAVMDFGCGPGFYTIPFARVAKRVVGVDIQPEMLEKAESYAKKAGVKVEFVESDGTRIPLPDESLDLVFLNLVYHEIEDKKTTLFEFRRLLKPGGNVAIREKTENTLLPVGPPVIPVDAIRSQLQEVGFRKAFGVGNARKMIVIGVK